MAVHVVTAAARPDLAERADKATAGTVSEWMRHAGTVSRFWGSLYDIHPELQLVLWDEEGDTVLGEANTILCVWDGTAAGLPGGVDDVLEQAFTQEFEPNTLCALNVRIVPGFEGRGLSKITLEEMRRFAAERAFRDLIAPVRPIWKKRYPLTPIDRYAHWRREDGLPFDPWIRTHVRLGAEILAVARESVRISGTVAEWEAWTGMAFPESGRYVIPGGQVPLTIDRERDLAIYVEPDVWMRHRLPSPERSHSR
jgi:hypothetical protein